IHEEMPQQENGLLRGFQIWLNLPSATKMQPAQYRDIPVTEIPVRELDGGGFVNLIAGTLLVEGQPLVGPGHSVTTEPIIADVSVAPGQTLELPVPATHQ